MKRVLSNKVDQLVGKDVMMQGWAATVRDHSKVLFIDLRDRTGSTQVVFTGDILEQARKVTAESVITIEGTVSERPQTLVNPNLVSGSVELQAKKIVVETAADSLPIPLDDRSVSEEARLRYRYLDLRSKKMAENIRTRAKLNNFQRDYLSRNDFTEVETPYLSKSTPEGARDYLVPSRIDPGKFYALPQSPQQYKQLLMVAGMERYFQIVRCFRDEDARGDRQPEFTQLDIELSFTNEEEIMELVEQMYLDLVQKFFPEKILTFKKFPRLRYGEVIKEHGNDRPDLRQDKTNDDELAFAFIVDFPLFEWKESEKRFDATHHPFTSPQAEYENNFEKKPKEALAMQYDLVLNGSEIAGGSIRIHRPEILQRVFEFLGHKIEKVEHDFGHILNAFKYGVPPHGGIAVGLDRLYMILLKESTIRDVIAFAKAGDGKDLMMNAPDSVEPAQLKDLGIKLN
ncbi:MAG: amino acid--tRNA ligase-related protein [Patescibacteria group bacterium]